MGDFGVVGEGLGEGGTLVASEGGEVGVGEDVVCRGEIVIALCVLVVG